MNTVSEGVLSSLYIGIIYVYGGKKKATDKLFHPSPGGVAKTVNKPLVVSATCKQRGVYM